MPSLPTGTITYLLTDIEGSTKLWEQHSEIMHLTLARHDAFAASLVKLHNGVLVKSRGEGDSLFAVFPRATDAVTAACSLQNAFTSEPWPAETPLRVRMALHTGETDLREGDYYGPAVNRCARLRSAGHGGQILLSDTTQALARPGLPPNTAFQDCGVQRLRDVGEERVWQLLHPDLPRDFPPLKTLDPERHNLPLPLTPIIGRETEVAACQQLLHRPATRLLTLVGFGGIGKTRTALQVAELCVDAFAEGVWWVDLQEARTGDGMIQRIAYPLGLTLQPQPSIQEQILAFLRERQRLLILDNTEQIPDAADVIHALLHAAPHIKCLVTARRPLELRAEQLVEIMPLPSSDAEQLFLDRARGLDAGFTRTSENAADITELCRRLEGVPLAIELASTRIVGMTPHEMVDRLSERFRLLQSRAPDLPPRQRALRGTIDWSHALLTEDNRVLLAQLAVFASGFTIADVEAVCEAPDVFESVLELRKHSLLQAETAASRQQTHYRMLEAVRDFAEEQLKAFSDHGSQVWQRHAEYFLRFAEQRVALMRTREEAAALDALGSAYDNLRAAMRWAWQNGQGELCARLTLALYPLLFRRGFWTEARQCLQAGWEATEGLEGEAHRLRAAIGGHLASIAQDMGDLVEARRQAEACLALQHELKDPLGIAEARNLLAYLATDRGDIEIARQHFEAALSLLAEKDHNTRGIVLHNFARLHSRRGEVAEARRLYEEALVHRRAAGDTRGEAETLGNLGALAHNGGNHAKARHFYQQGLALYQVQRYPYGIAVMLNNLGELAELDGDLENALALLVHAERLFRKMHAADARVPQAAVQRLANLLGAERAAELRAAAEARTWEELTERRP